jgi:polyisoprenoid-binding protein YceI
MRRFLARLGAFALVFFATSAIADRDEEIFEPGDHCVAYRTVKDILFAVDAEIIGRSCQVTASLVTAGAGSGPQVVVTVPVKSLKSGNFLRNKAVADLLGSGTQPDLRFTSNPIDVDALRGDITRQSFHLSGTLTLGGKDFPLEFPLEIFEHEGRHYVKSRLSTTFEAFEIEVPTVAGGLIARPHEGLEIVVHLELERVDGLETWAAQQELLQ